LELRSFQTPSKGDRAFLIRLGQEPKGIFASGTISRGSFKDSHWDEEKAELGETSYFVELDLDTLLNPQTDTILPRKRLNIAPFSEMYWDTQMSGVRIRPTKVAEELEKIWVDFENLRNFRLPEEIDGTETIYEGAVRQILVNAYERNAEARRKCIDHYGDSCVACGFNFGITYGEAAEGFIHVHHLQQLSKIGKEYKVDPIGDLRPVCPNCHAMIHVQKEALSIEQVKELLRQANKR